jgi:signal transduction histidine kinase
MRGHRGSKKSSITSWLVAAGIVTVAFRLWRNHRRDAKHRGEAERTREEIERAGAEAIEELRATLEAVRSSDDPTAHGLYRVPALVERAQAVGLEASLQVTGEPRPVPVEIDHMAYHVVREALTNASRHAGPAAALVSVAYSPHVLTVQVVDDGRGVDGSPAPGPGLLGMRERVTALGGHLEASAGPTGGFAVTAELPVRT